MNKTMLVDFDGVSLDELTQRLRDQGYDVRIVVHKGTGEPVRLWERTETGAPEDTEKTPEVSETPDLAEGQARLLTGIGKNGRRFATRAQKLTPEQAREIYRLAHESGLLYREIAPQFNVSVGMIEGIANGRYWAHETGHVR